MNIKGALIRYHQEDDISSWNCKNINNNMTQKSKDQIRLEIQRLFCFFKWQTVFTEWYGILAFILLKIIFNNYMKVFSYLIPFKSGIFQVSFEKNFAFMKMNFKRLTTLMS